MENCNSIVIIIISYF